MRFERRRTPRVLALAGLGLALGAAGCSDDDLSATGGDEAASASEGSESVSSASDETSGTDETSETGDSEDTGPEPWTPTEPFERELYVNLDGEPLEGAVIAQGGMPMRWTTDAEGYALVVIDPSVVGGELFLTAAWVSARIVGAPVVEDPAPLVIELTSFSTTGNLEYVFQDPGTPEDNGNTGKCAHCHISINADWSASPHRYAAQNTIVQDIYSGAAAAFDDESTCVDAGGQWRAGLDPATGEATVRCYLGKGTLPDLNADCGDTESCDGIAEEFGDCADCHAPAIDGVLGGRDLLEAGGIAGDLTQEGNRAYEYGVHCDLCHKISEIHLDEKPGMGGRLDVILPSEPASASLGYWQPLTFAPYDDVSHIKMGASPRDFFTGATICAGCHELSEAPRLPGASIDLARWPDGKLPIHTTYSEWQAGVLGGITPCQACHMPPDADVLNSADLSNPDNAGLGSGWIREPGSVRRHVWGGPRTPESGLLDIVSALFVEHQVAGPNLEVALTVRNAGAGHRIPTGEPMRSLILLVEADCGGVALSANGGEVVPRFGGNVAQKNAGDDWTTWPSALVGQVIRVVDRPGPFIDYSGYGPFGDGSFDATQKGMPVENFVGESIIVAVNGGVVTLDAPLPAGDVAYLGDPLPVADGGLPYLAGAPGFAFARVLADPDGELMVPHYRAIDVVSDNRLEPQAEWTSLHSFDLGGGCAQPQVRARLLYRPLPPKLAGERGWSRGDITIAEVLK